MILFFIISRTSRWKLDSDGHYSVAMCVVYRPPRLRWPQVTQVLRRPRPQDLAGLAVGTGHLPRTTRTHLGVRGGSRLALAQLYDSRHNAD